MVNYLVGIHAALGEIGAIAFLWVFVELLGASEAGWKRARVAALGGVLAFLASWFTAGAYYLGPYAESVKPIIKAGPEPWAHSVFMEVKEHLFLMLPFLGILIAYSLWTSGPADTKARRGVLYLSMLTALLALAMAGMGYLITGGYRSAIEEAPQVVGNATAAVLPLLVAIPASRRLRKRGVE